MKIILDKQVFRVELRARLTVIRQCNGYLMGNTLPLVGVMICSLGLTGVGIVAQQYLPYPCSILTLQYTSFIVPTPIVSAPARYQ